MQPMLNIALRAARSAGELIFRSIERLDVIAINEKTPRTTSPKSTALRGNHHPGPAQGVSTHGILGEGGTSIAGTGEGADYQWIIDPLDGTTNFIRGVPHFAVSIACKYRAAWKTRRGPRSGPPGRFTASRGRGAALKAAAARQQPQEPGRRPARHRLPLP